MTITTQLQFRHPFVLSFQLCLPSTRSLETGSKQVKQTQDAEPHKASSSQVQHRQTGLVPRLQALRFSTGRPAWSQGFKLSGSAPADRLGPKASSPCPGSPRHRRACQATRKPSSPVSSVGLYPALRQLRQLRQLQHATPVVHKSSSARPLLPVATAEMGGGAMYMEGCVKSFAAGDVIFERWMGITPIRRHYGG
jgi:hypothetical protein